MMGISREQQKKLRVDFTVAICHAQNCCQESIPFNFSSRQVGL